MWEPSQRYPDPAVQVIDASFNRYRLPLASVERLFTGCRWSEGPGVTSDRNFFAAIREAPHGRVDRATVRYGIRPTNVLNQFLRESTRF